MRGEILKYDSISQKGLISGIDGKRYEFSKTDVSEDIQLTKGQYVDFSENEDEGFAKDIYILNSLENERLDNVEVSENLSTIETIQDNGNMYKKFDFSQITDLLKNEEVIHHLTKKNKITHAIFAIILIPLGLILCTASLWWIILVLIGFRSAYMASPFFRINRLSFLSNFKEIFFEKYYKVKLQKISKITDESLYTTIAFINGVSKDDLYEQAFKLKADALMDLNLQKYTSTNVSSHFNGIGAQRAVRSKVNNHENWTAYAINFKTSTFHEPFNPKKIMS